MPSVRLKRTLARACAGLGKLETLLASLVLILIAVFPALEVLARKLLKTGIPSSADFVRHLILWITFLGGTITSRENRHLTLSAGIDLIKGRANRTIRTATALIAVSISTAMTWSSLSLVLIGFDPTKRVGFIPIQLVLLIMPVGFLIIAFRFITAAPPGALSRTVASLGLAAGSFLAASSLVNVLYSVYWELPPFWDILAELSYTLTGPLVVPLIIAMIVAALAGMPIFIVLGGIAYLLFIKSYGSLEVIPNEAYTMLTGSTIPAIPLFTLTGFILSESNAGKRLAFCVLGTLLMVEGIGLYLKSRMAWFALFAYIILGTAWVVAGANFDSRMTEGEAFFVTLFGLLGNGVLAVGLYFVTRPAFRPGAAQQENTETKREG